MWSSIASIILFSIGVRNGAVAYSKKERNLDTTNLIQALDEVKNEIDNKLFLYLTPDYQWIPSTVYRYDDFLESLKIMSEIGVAGKLFYTGENVDNGHVYGLINIAAFLAQSMKETIQYDACDENSWDLIGGKYPLSNACGQLGQSYQDYHCSDEEKHMECPVDPNMSITAVTHAKWYGAPGPLFCGPKSEYSFTGIWDHLYECNRPWANPPEMCSVYEGQKAGRYDNSAPYANNAGRTDVEGCCWWGRGVIQTSGVCNFGKLNYYLGARAAADGRDSRYPTIDFCKDPEVICSSAEYKELKWIAGMFYWMESVQTYNVDGWDYLTELRSFVEGGMTGTSFIDAVSGIVNRGCHNPPCGTGELDGRMERSDNFNKVLDAFFGGVVPQVTAPITVSDTPDTSDSLTESNPSSAVSTPIPTRQPVSPSSEAGLVLNSDTFVNLAKALDDSKGDIDSKLFLYLTPDYQWIPSSVYRYDDFFESVRIMASEGVAGKRLYIGLDRKDGFVLGLVNIAAFLAQSMKETIQYDACDENSWDLIGGKYPLSNACGQLGQSYQDYHCSDEEKHMECPVDPNMSITAVTHAKWYGAPGPLFCGPKTEYSFTGIWDHLYECNRPWANPPETCSVYEGQKAGRYDNSAPYANNAGRTDVEGCCWWGRGVIQTSGVCNFGKLNYYLGARAAADGRDSRYPTIDFCKDPEVICSSAEYKELKWIAGMFYWMESVQTYNVDGWDYLTELRSFVEGGMTGTSFIDAVSGIVNRGCHNPPCGTGVVDGGWERSENFQKVLSVFFNGAPPTLGPFESIEIIDDEISSNSTDFDLEIDVSGLVETTFPPQPSQPLPQPLPQPQPKPQNVVVYKCEGTIDIPPNSPIIDILFDYEVFMLSNVQAAHLLPELKEKIMEDLAASFGCDVSFGRNLRAGQENYLLGFQYIEDGDVIDGQKALCDDSGIEDPSLQCVPVIGHVAGFFKSDTPTKIVEETKSEILDNIEHGMEESRYSTNFVQRVVFVSEREYETQSKLDSADHGTSLSSSTFSPGESSSSTPVWVPVICTLLAIAIIASGFALIVRKRMNKIVHEPNNFEDHRDSDKAELDCTFDAGLSGHRDTSDGDDYNGRDSASCCQDICGDSFETNSSTHFESDEGWASPLSRNPVKSTTSGKAGLHCSKYNSADLFSESSSDTNIGPQIANEGHSFDMDPKSYDQSTTDYQGNDGVNFVLVESGSASPYMHSFNHNNRFVCNDYASDENNNEGSNEVQSEASFEGRSSAHRQIKNDTDFDSSINYPESDENQVGTDHGALTGRNHHYSRANNIIFDQPSGESAASSVGAQYVGKKLSSVFFETNDATGETFINNGWKDRNVGKDDIEEESDGDETFDC